MAITSGFYDSQNGDRTYNADQMGSIFDGVILDGVYAHLGESLAVSAVPNTMTVRVGTGRAWCLNTWLVNDSTLTLTIPKANQVYTRRDYVVIDVDKSLNVRAGTIMYIPGSESTASKLPTLQNTSSHKQIPLAIVNVKPGVKSITAANVQQLTGTNQCPWVSAPLQTISASNLYENWEQQWTEWFNNAKQNIGVDQQQQTNQFNTWFNNLKALTGDKAVAYLAAEVIKLQEILAGFKQDMKLYDMLRDNNNKIIYDSSKSAIDGTVIYAPKSIIA